MSSNKLQRATRQRVIRAVEQTRLATKELAELQGRSRGWIGLIVADAENPFFAQIVSPIESVAYDFKRGLILCNSDEDPERERYHLAQLLSHCVDGVIILPVSRDASSLEPYRSQFPIVTLDRRLPDADLDLAIVDNVLGSEMAVRHFVELRHERIAVIGAHHETLNVERIGGFERSMAALKLLVRPDYVRRGSDARQCSGYEQTLHLLRLAEPPTAILTLNHLLTLGAMLAIRDTGLRIPQDVSLVGFDEAPWARLLDPALTTVSQPASKLGLAAANLLIDRLDRNYAGPAREVMLEPTLIVRGSTAPPQTP